MTHMLTIFIRSNAWIITDNHMDLLLNVTINPDAFGVRCFCCRPFYFSYSVSAIRLLSSTSCFSSSGKKGSTRFRTDLLVF